MHDLKRRTLERGQVLPFIAILIGVLLGFTGLAVDVGYLRYQQRLQQSATDSAALAGAAEKLYGTNLVTAAQSEAATNGFTDGVDGVSVTANNPPSAGGYTGDSGAVEAVISAPRPTFFMRIFGRPTVTITTRAVATASSNNNFNCLYTLLPGANTNFNSGTFNMPTCGMVLDGTANMRGATVDAASIEYGSSQPNENSASFPHASPVSAIPASDPCPQISGCAFIKSNPPSTNPCNSQIAAGGFAAPGCYGDVTVGQGKTVTFSPGTYVINGNFNANKATLIGNNVTFIITANGSMNFNQASLNLSAPTTGDYANMLFYSTDSTAPNFNMTTSNSLTGVVYFPNATVNFNKTGGGYILLIFGAANFNSGTENWTGMSSGASYIKEPVLVE